MKKEHFISRATEVHGDKFSYELLPDEFKSNDKVKITCRKHGVFEQTSGNHITNARGCPACGSECRSVNNRKPLSYFQKTISKKFPDLLVDYTGYVDSFSLVTIFCPIHGKSSKTIKDMLRASYQCNECAKENKSLYKRNTKEHFLDKAIQIHGDRYDYSLVDLGNNTTPVSIICKAHGKFEQTPSSHCKGSGCPKCASERVGKLRRTNISDLPEYLFKDVYSKPALETYTKYSEKMKFICLHHGEFFRDCSKLKSEFICPKCNREFVNRSKIDTETFVSQISKIRPDYDFSKVEYINNTTHVEVVCDKGHLFTARPANLKSGHGCPVCHGDTKGLSIRKGKEFYIEKSIESHGNKYDYSLVEFGTCKDKVVVVCPDHGEFICTMDNHSRGKGCPKCSSATSGYKANQEGTFYILKVTDSVGKFGISNNFDKRLKQIQNSSCFEIDVLYRFDFQDGYVPRKIESSVISSDIKKNVVNRCDMKTGYTETFYLVDLDRIIDVVNDFTNNLSL